MSYEKILVIQRKNVEKNAVDAEKGWEQLLPKICEHKQELIDWNIASVDSWEDLSPEEKIVEKNAFTALLEMTPQQVGECIRNYYKVTRVAPYGKHGWTPTLEAQMHYMNNVVGRVREQKW